MMQLTIGFVTEFGVCPENSKNKAKVRKPAADKNGSDRFNPLFRPQH
jgi:hypothetical protein